MLECACHESQGIRVKICASVSATCHGAFGAPFGSSVLSAAQAPGELIYSVLNHTPLIVYICVPCAHVEIRGKF